MKKYRKLIAIVVLALLLAFSFIVNAESFAKIKIISDFEGYADSAALWDKTVQSQIGGLTGLESKDSKFDLVTKDGDQMLKIELNGSMPRQYVTFNNGFPNGLNVAAANADALSMYIETEDAPIILLIRLDFLTNFPDSWGDGYSSISSPELECYDMDGSLNADYFASNGNTVYIPENFKGHLIFRLKNTDWTDMSGAANLKYEHLTNLKSMALYFSSGNDEFNGEIVYLDDFELVNISQSNQTPTNTPTKTPENTLTQTPYVSASEITSTPTPTETLSKTGIKTTTAPASLTPSSTPVNTETNSPDWLLIVIICAVIIAAVVISYFIFFKKKIINK